VLNRDFINANAPSAEDTPDALQVDPDQDPNDVSEVISDDETPPTGWDIPTTEDGRRV